MHRTVGLLAALPTSLAHPIMRRPRLKSPPGLTPAYYHCVSRVVDRNRRLSPPEKEIFRSLMRQCEEFCEVRILTYCILDNHFHLLVEVPPPPPEKPSLEVMLAKIDRLNGHQGLETPHARAETLRQLQDPDTQARHLARLHARLWDISAFMKVLKQRFTQGFNRRHQRQGTLWEERFRSVLVEGAGQALASIAGYIDLNPIRASVVADPKDYRWTGYGEAVAGDPRAQAGIQTLARALNQGLPADAQQALETYRMHIYQKGSEDREARRPDGQPMRRSLSSKKVAEVLRNKGRLALCDYIRCRVRYFCDGWVLGSRAFVEATFQSHRDWFSRKRQTGARALPGLSSETPLFTVRNFRLRVFG